MNYQETIEYLYHKLPMFSKIGEKAIKKNLDNITTLCHVLGNPHLQFKSIHIAGTNGKGSTAHGLASIFQAQKLKTGLYTSPHIIDFRERIKINGKNCSKKFIVDSTQKLLPFIEQIQPSFFEITVAMAFYYFAKKKIDIAIIETGLGGRLDSTNIIIPELSVITNISYDHQNLLGNTLTQIATEKAGIIKPKKPVVIGRKNKETDNIFLTIAAKNKSEIIFSDDIIQVFPLQSTSRYQHLNYTVGGKSYSIKTDLLGNYQTENIKTILASIATYNQYHKNKIKQKNIKKGLANIQNSTGLMARWQSIAQKPKIIIDVAHNEDGIKKTIHQLQYEKYDNLHIIYSAVKDKDVDKILCLLPTNAIYYFTEAKIERKLDAEALQLKAKQHNLNGNVYKKPNIALKKAKNKACKNDLILIVGSFFILENILGKKK